MSKDMKYISRVDSEEQRHHCWRVDINIDRERVTRTFCDKKLGGESLALFAAICFRQDMVIKHRLNMYKAFKKQPFLSYSKGVYIKKKTNNGGKGTSLFAVAFWRETGKDGKRKTKYKSFSYTKYGKKVAMFMARQYRAEKLVELYL